MKNNRLTGPLLLLGAAVVWGFGFVAQDLGAVHVGGFTFQASRTALAALVLLLIVLVRDAWQRKKGTFVPMTKRDKGQLLLGGVLCGSVLCAATAFQQFGIANNMTSPGKDAFITALYIVMVPLFGLFLGRRARWHVYVCVVFAVVGLWLLCMSGSSLSLGDVQVICSAAIFAVHILLLDYFAPRVDGLKLSFVQFSTVAIFSAILMLIFEQPRMESIMAASGAILYAGLGSTAAGYTLQILGQRRTPSTLASMIMSLESVFAVVASAILLPELTPFTMREVMGMVIIFVAIICARLEPKGKKKTA